MTTKKQIIGSHIKNYPHLSIADLVKSISKIIRQANKQELITELKKDKPDPLRLKNLSLRIFNGK